MQGRHNVQGASNYAPPAQKYRWNFFDIIRAAYCGGKIEKDDSASYIPDRLGGHISAGKRLPVSQCLENITRLAELMNILYGV